MLVAFAVPFFVGKGQTRFIFEALGDDSVEGYWKAFFFVSLAAGALLVYAGKSQLPAKNRAKLGLFAATAWFVAYLNLLTNFEDLARTFSGGSGNHFNDFIGFNFWFPAILLAGGVGARVRQLNPSSGPAKALLAVSAAGILSFMFIGHPIEGESQNRFSLFVELLNESDTFQSYQIFAIFGALGYLMLIPAAIVALMGLGNAKIFGAMRMTSWFLLGFHGLFWIAAFFVGFAASNGNFLVFGLVFIGIWFGVMANTLAVGAVALFEPDAESAPAVGHFHQAQIQGGASRERTPCPKCGQRSRWIEEYSRSYCDRCAKYLPRMNVSASRNSSAPDTQATAEQSSSPAPPCEICTFATTWVAQYERFYCYPCKKYV